MILKTEFPFRQSVEIPFAPVPTSSSAAASGNISENLSIMDCLLHPDVASIINSLSPFSKLISVLELGDITLMDFLGLSDSNGDYCVSSLVPILISTIVRAQKWSVFFMNEMRSVSVLSDALSKPSFSISCSRTVLLQNICQCIASLRTCLERKVVVLLHMDMTQALESILRNRSPQVLATIGQYLTKIRSDKASFIEEQSTAVSQKETARAHQRVTCCLCNACPLFEFVRSKGKDPVCMQCYASVLQSNTVRPCDLLSLYALKLLRGEAKLNDEDTKAVLSVFEYVYPAAEFAASKAALMCICATLHAFMFSRTPASSRGISKIALPRWVAHALFPEYAVNVAFSLGDSAPHQFAATLGWCECSSDPSCAVTPLERAVLDACAGDSNQTGSRIAAKSGT